MHSVTQISTALQMLLTTTANDLAHETGFVRRTSKLTGAQFAQALVFGWLDAPQATVQQLAQMAGTVGVAISPQGLDQRFSPAAAQLLYRLLEAAIQQVVATDPVAIPLLQRFAGGVYLLDSSTIVLPDELAALWPGCGGRSRSRSRSGSGSGSGVPGAHTAAAVKLQVQVDLLTGALRGPVIQQGRMHDRAAPQQTEFPRGALRLADLGYFRLEVFSALQEQGCYWLSRLHALTQVFDAQGQELPLVEWLATRREPWLDLPVTLGVAQRLPARLLAVRVAPEVAAARRKRLHADAQRRGRPVSLRRLALADWTLLVTNVPATLLSREEALVLVRARWQIELLFKLWKDQGLLDESRSRKPWRRLCEFYAKLLGLVLQHWLLVLSCWHHPDRSLRQAAQTVRRYATTVALALPTATRLAHILHQIQVCLRVGCRITKRQQAPSTYQLLLACP
jgi:hypothetical protein